MLSPSPQVQADYADDESRLMARTRRGKVGVFALYLVPGLVLALLINVRPLHDLGVRLTGLESYHYQFWMVISLVLLWHVLVPILAMWRRPDFGLADVVRALGLARFSASGFFLITPAFFIIVCVLSVPYLIWGFPIVNSALSQVPLFRMPEYSLFNDPTAFLSFPVWMVTLGLFANFFGEEVYFRGYLLKKSAFLGRANLWVHAALFAIYHFWQIPMTYALGPISLAFSVYFLWRKNLYEVMLLHALINLALPSLMAVIATHFAL